MTGYEYVRMALKRFLSESRLDTNFLEYLRTTFTDGIARIFPSQGLFTFPVSLTNNGDGTFTIGTDPTDGTDGSGHILRLTGASRCQNIPFENGGAENYWIGLHHIEIPSGVYANPRTGVPEYDKTIEEVGVKGTPDSIVDMGGGRIRITVDSVFEAGVDNTDRTVRVYLVNPLSLDEAVAFEDVAVQYAAGSNYIETAGSLGQGTISVVAANYEVAALGVTVRKSVANPFPADYVIIGYVIGGGAAESVDDEVDLSGGGGHTLQKAYDGLGGVGSGRTITADSQAVLIRQESTVMREHDIANAALRIEKDMSTAIFPATPPADVSLDVKSHPAYGGMLIVRVPLADMKAASDLLRVEEDCDLVAASAQINLTRAAVDLYLTGCEANIRDSRQDMVEVSGSASGQDGLYFIQSIVDANSITVRELDGTTPSFAAEAGLTIRFYRPILLIGRNSGVLAINTMEDFFRDAYGGAFSQIGLNIDVPENVGTGDVIYISRDVTGEIYTMDVDGNVEMHGELDTNGNNIRLSTGDIVMGENPADGGDLFMKGGTIADAGTISIVAGVGIGVSMGGTTIDNCGKLDMKSLAGGGLGIDMNGSEIADCGDITQSDGSISAYHNVTTTTGYIQAKTMLNAEVSVQADCEGNGTGEFIYGLAKSYFKIIGAEDAIGDSNAVFHAGYQTDEGGDQSPFWTEGGSDAYVIFPISIPIGASLTEVKVLCVQTGDDAVRAELVRQTNIWTGTVVARDSISGPTNSGAGAGAKVITLTPGGGVTIASGTKYSVLVKLKDTGSGIVHQVRVAYDLTTIKPEA